MIRRFRRKVSQFRILQEARRRAFYTPDSLKRKLDNKNSIGRKKKRRRKRKKYALLKNLIQRISAK